MKADSCSQCVYQHCSAVIYECALSVHTWKEKKQKVKGVLEPKKQRECVQNKLVAERRGSVTKNEGSNNGSPFRGSDRGVMSQQSSSDLDKSLMQVCTVLHPTHHWLKFSIPLLFLSVYTSSALSVHLPQRAHSYVIAEQFGRYILSRDLASQHRSQVASPVESSIWMHCHNFSCMLSVSVLPFWYHVQQIPERGEQTTKVCYRFKYDIENANPLI